ncbi:MAG: hypothetical protein COA43_11330 [Robiginitomaculum sp.]|nr:MAG: hypothetical protein COA43_11330 [Robiginitomaculum sp.]
MINSTYRYFTILSLLVFCVFWGLSSLTQGPHPKSVNAPTDQFSAMRAFAELESLVGNNQAHPSGSLENLRIRKAIEKKFVDMGYTPEIQKGLGCTLHYPGCTEIENIVVVLKGTNTDSNNTIMLTSHYDSVPAGPAAADDGVGVVAMLEIARILKTTPPLKNDILFLITDGEEGGLRGAQEFTDRGTMIKNVKLVINLESRGASGPSSMFETSDGNLALIKGYARHTPRPAATSLSYEIYSRLPNDTDYSIYKKQGIMGLNYAFTGDVALYHSKHDTVENLDKTSLQHHGDNMLAAVHAFGNADLEALNGTVNATYIDVFGKVLLHWNAGLNLPLSIWALLLLGFAKFKSRTFSKTDTAFGLTFILGSLGAVIAVMIASPLMGWLLSFPLGRWPDLFYLDHPQPWPGRLAILFASLFVGWSVTQLMKRWLDYNALVIMNGIVFSVIALALSIYVSGASYIFLIPALGITLGAMIDIWRKHERLSVAAHIGLILALYMAVYHYIAIEVIVHYKQSAIRILPLILFSMTLLPIFVATPRRISEKLGIGFGVLMICCTFISFSLPGFNTKHPRAHNLVYVQGYETGKAAWISETSTRQDEVFLKAAGFETSIKPYGLMNILWGKAVAKKASPAKFLPPVYTIIDNIVSGDIRTLTLNIRSSNAGYALNIGFDAESIPYSVEINGQMAADYRVSAYRRPVAIRGAALNTYNVVIKGPADQVLNMAIIDSLSLKLEQLEGMEKLRADISAPLHSGDRAHIYTPISIGCEEYCKASNK